MRSHLLQLENHCSTQLKRSIGKLHMTTHNPCLGASLDPRDIKKNFQMKVVNHGKNFILYLTAIFYRNKGFRRFGEVLYVKPMGKKMIS